jgi:hypothetical protein
MAHPPEIIDWLLDGMSIAALLALPIVGRRAFFIRTYVRIVVVLVIVLIVTANVVPPLGIDGSVGVAIVAFATLIFACVRAIAMLPARRRWLAESATNPLVLAAPFEGRWKALIGGPDPGVNHHLIASDQRFAYDFIRAGAQSLGSTIVAPVAGRVVSACDGRPDHPASLRVTEDPMPLGNHVAIDSGRGVVFLCHLQNGSVLVHTGDAVEVGTALGRCGNSGRTSRPHLHIHAQDLPEYAFNRARGIAIAFPTPLGPKAPRVGATISGPVSTALSSRATSRDRRKHDW